MSTSSSSSVRRGTAPRVFRKLLLLLFVVCLGVQVQARESAGNSMGSPDGTTVPITLEEGSVRYAVSHPLASYEGTLDVSNISSALVFDPASPAGTAGWVEVDLLGFTSRNKARDRHAQRSLETSNFPLARLKLKGLLSVERGEAPGRLRGICDADLVLHGRTVRWPVAIELVWSASDLLATSSFSVLLDEFGIRRDKLFGVPIRNEVPVSVELRYRRP